MRLASVRNSMDEELSWENDIEVRWIKYFVQLLNGDEISEVGVRRVRIGRIKSIYKDGKVRDNGYTKEDGMNGFVLEMLKNGGITIIEWLLRIFNICMEFGDVPENWKATCIIPIYNGQSDRRECANY